MKALRLSGGKLELADAPRPQPAAGECLIRVVKSGICNTDLEIVKGYGDFTGVLGHEFVGLVESSPDRPNLIGKRIVAAINIGCGNCPVCRTGDERHCPQRTVVGIKDRDGCHAEFVALPARSLFEVPDTIADTDAVFAEPLAAAIGIAESVEILPDSQIAIVGDGKLGLLCARSISLLADSVTLIGKHREKLALAAAGRVKTLMANEAGDVRQKFDIVVEASGSPAGFAMALDLVRPRGEIVLKSTFHGRTEIDAWRLVVDEISVVGSRCGRLRPALDLLGCGRVTVSDLVADEFNIDKALDAFRRAGEPGVLKVILSY